MIASSVAGFRIVFASATPPLYDHYIRHAKLSESFGLSDDGDYLLVGASQPSREWPTLVVEQRYDPGIRSGFTPGVHLMTETSILLIGAGTRLLAYDILRAKRLWQDKTSCGFERDDLDWWAEEMWLLESLWSPVGYPTYLRFLVDPQGSGLARGVGDAVWAVLASPSKPATWLEGADASRFGLGRHWADGMPALFEYLASLRFNALNVRTAGPSEQSQ